MNLQKLSIQRAEVSFELNMALIKISTYRWSCTTCEGDATAGLVIGRGHCPPQSVSPPAERSACPADTIPSQYTGILLTITSLISFRELNNKFNKLNNKRKVG